YIPSVAPALGDRLKICRVPSLIFPLSLRAALPISITPHSHSHTHSVLSRSSIISLRARTRCTWIKDSLWRALYHTTLIPGLRPGGLALGYKHSAPLGLGERLKS